MAKVKRGGEVPSTVLDKSKRSTVRKAPVAKQKGKPVVKESKKPKLQPPVQEVPQPARKLSRLEQIDGKLKTGLDRLLCVLHLQSSKTSELALKLLMGSVKELLKWVDPATVSELECIRWAAACVFIAQRSKNLAGNPKEHKSLRQLLATVVPETMIGFLERCDCVFSATDPLVWNDAEMMTSAVKSLARFRRSIALTFTLKKSFERLYKQMMSMLIPELSPHSFSYDLSQRICWTAWCILRKQLWKTLANPTELLHSQVAFLSTLVFESSTTSSATSSDHVHDDRATPPDAPPALIPLSGSSSSGTLANNRAPESRITIEEFTGRLHEPSCVDLDQALVLKMTEAIRESIPDVIKPLFENRFCASAEQTLLVSLADQVNSYYEGELSTDLMTFDERTEPAYRFEGETVIWHVRRDNCAIWVCQQVNRYSRQLFSEGTRKVMRSCIPDPTDDIEARVEAMVLEFGAHCAEGVSDYRGTTALYSAFFDGIVESEMKQEQLLGGALLRSDIFHRSLFAVAAHAMGYFADIPKYPEVLSICKVPALDFFKAGQLLIENSPQLLPGVIKERVVGAMMDVIHRRGWRQSERYLNFVSADRGLPGPAASSSSSSSAITLSGDGVFLSRVRDELHETIFDVAAASGMLTLTNGRALLWKALALANLVLKDATVMKNRNLRTIAMCSLYCSARAHQTVQTSFESLLRTLLDLTPPQRVKEVQMDLSIIEIDESHKGHVIEFYNNTFLRNAKRHIDQAGLSVTGIKAPLADEERDSLVQHLSPMQRSWLEEPKCMVQSSGSSTITFRGVPNGVTGLPFIPKSKIMFGLGFNRKFFAYD